jgi:rhodanese-related sulfurtransferase
MMDSIRPAELAERIEAGEDIFLLDLRPEAEYDGYHIEGSYNAPVYHELQADGKALEPFLEDIPTDSLIVTVCRVGSCARDATTALEDRGYDSAVLKGGIKHWRGFDEDTVSYRLRTFLRNVIA